MKKFISLCLLLVFMLCGCNQQSLNKNLNSISKKQQTDATNFSTANENSSLESQQTTDAQKIYENFLNDLKNKQDDLYYFIKDIDGNNIDDLLVLENTKLSVYTYEKSVELIGEQDFLTGTVRFFSSDNISYPGVFYFTVGGGVNHYGYMTIKEKKLSFENLWEENFTTEPQNSVNRIKELSSNKDLISESKILFDKNLDIKFLSLK